MTDKTETGFARNPDGINRKGRPVGSKNKLPTDPALKELLKKNAPEAVQTLIRIMRGSGSEANVLKAAVKIIDMTYTVVLNDEKLNGPSPAKGDTTPEKPTEEKKSVVLHMTQKG